MILLPTDGLADSISSTREVFGPERVCDTVYANREKSAREIVETLYRESRSFAQGHPQVDDTTAIIVKVLE